MGDLFYILDHHNKRALALGKAYWTLEINHISVDPTRILEVFDAYPCGPLTRRHTPEIREAVKTWLAKYAGPWVMVKSDTSWGSLPWERDEGLGDWSGWDLQWDDEYPDGWLPWPEHDSA